MDTGDKTRCAGKETIREIEGKMRESVGTVSRNTTSILHHLVRYENETQEDNNNNEDGYEGVGGKPYNSARDLKLWRQEADITRRGMVG